MQVQVVRSSHLTQQQMQFRRNLALTVGLGSGAVVCLLLPVSGLLPGQEGWSFWFPAVLGLSLAGGAGWFGWQIWLYLDARSSQERLCLELGRFLNDDFIYFRNLTLPGTRSVGEIDGVLLGSHGALVLQVEQSQGDFSCEGDTWYRYRGSRTSADFGKNRRRVDDSPTWAAIRAGREVKAWLSVRELPLVPVRPVVVLSRGKIYSLKRPSCQVMELDAIKTFIQTSLLQEMPPLVIEPISGGTVEQIAQRLQS